MPLLFELMKLLVLKMNDLSGQLSTITLPTVILQSGDSLVVNGRSSVK